MKMLRGIGIEERLRKTSFAPYSHLNRDGYTGEITRELPMPESLYNAPSWLPCIFEDGSSTDAVVGADVCTRSCAKSWWGRRADPQGHIAYWTLTHEMVGYRPSHRHLLYHQSKERVLRHQRAGAGRVGSRENPGRPRATQRKCARRTRASIRMCATPWKPVRIVINGRFSSASRCRAGAMGAWFCSAMPRIR